MWPVKNERRKSDATTGNRLPSMDSKQRQWNLNGTVRIESDEDFKKERNFGKFFKY